MSTRKARLTRNSMSSGGSTTCMWRICLVRRASPCSLMTAQTPKNLSSLCTPLPLSGSNFVFPLRGSSAPCWLRLTWLLPNCTPTVGPSCGLSPFSATTLAIRLLWMCSSSGLTRASKGSSSRYATISMIRPCWTGSHSTGWRKQDLKSSWVLRTWPRPIARCVSSFQAWEWCLTLLN